MDRNVLLANGAGLSSVALRKESVDRNDTVVSQLRQTAVALRKESADRNDDAANALPCRVVALRKESVDRKFFDVSLNYKEVSLSARRAWIEMPIPALLL